MKTETIAAMRSFIYDVADMTSDDILKDYDVVLHRAKTLKRRLGEEDGQEPPSVVSDALNALRELGYRPYWNYSTKSITFYYFGNKCTFYPMKGYFNGKGLRPGHGLDNLIEQLKDNPQPIAKCLK